MTDHGTVTPALADRQVWHDISRAVDERAEDAISSLQELMRRPSVSATGEGVADCGRWLADWLDSLGVAAELLGEPDRPVVYGEVSAAAPAPTLLVYTHYDVQPVEPEAAWDHPPFGAVRAGDRIVGRGATDAKGNLAAHVVALDVLRGVLGAPPVNLRYLLDGEEEVGSPSLPGVVRAHRSRLLADGAVSFDGGIGHGDRPKITLGGKGILHVELRAQGPAGDLHSSKAALVESPAWRLVEALASLRDGYGRVAVDGFYDAVRPPGQTERRLLGAYPWDDQAEREALGVETFIGGVTGRAALERLLYEPTCNVSGVQAGYSGTGVKTVLPATAGAKLDLRLVPDQDPEEVFGLLVRHLERRGFDDVDVAMLGHVEPSVTDPGSPLVGAVARAGETVYGLAPAVKPIVEASGRQAVWLGTVLGMPGVQTGIGPPRWNGHAPNEFITIRHFVTGIKYACAVYLLAAESLQRSSTR